MSGLAGRIKSVAGASLPSKNTLTAATTLYLPAGTNEFYLTGTATVTSLGGPTTEYLPREITLIGESGATTLTNTTGTTTAGQMDLGGSNIVISAKDVVKLRRRRDGTWLLVSVRKNNASTTTIATGSSTTTITLPDTGDVFELTGTALVIAITASSSSRSRRVTFIGGASSAITFLHVNSPTSGQMSLRDADRLIGQNGILELIQLSSGVFILANHVQ